MEKKKSKISPEQIESACKNMEKAAHAADNAWDNLKGRLGLFGKALGFGMLVTFLFAIIKSNFLFWVFIIAVVAGMAPMIFKKAMEMKALGEQKLAEARAKKEAEQNKPEEKK